MRKSPGERLIVRKCKDERRRTVMNLFENGLEDGNTDSRDFNEALRAIALARGKRPEELLAEADRQIAEEMGRARDGCIQPDDLVDYQSGRPLSLKLETHITRCPSCNRLLRAAKPNPEHLRAFKEEVATIGSRYKEMQPAMRPSWMDWRAVASVSAAVAIIFLSADNRPRQQPLLANASHENVTISAKPTTDSNAVPVTIRVFASQRTSITVTDSDPKSGTSTATVANNPPTAGSMLDLSPERSFALLAASTAAVAKNPPTITLPPYAATDSTPDLLHQEATERTVAFVAAVLSASDENDTRFDMTSVSRAAKEEGFTGHPVWDASTGTLSLLFAVHNRKVITEISYLHTMNEAIRCQRLLELEGVPNGATAPTQIDLKNGVQLQMSIRGVSMGMTDNYRIIR